MNKQHGRENDSVVVETASEKSEVAVREEAIQAFWQQNDIFNKSLLTPGGGAPKGDFVFYDGPPFATGTPHYGHILAGTIKDAIPRFWTMNGLRVERKWGWDCHGLPLENLIEKKLGLATKRDIEAYGVKNFNEAARSTVMEYADEWKRVIPRMGRWANMDDDYKTMDSSYTESVWSVFAELYKKGLVFEGFKTMHLCPRCGTTLSNFEVNQGYKDIKDIAVTVKLPLLAADGSVTDTALLVWTTTSWTLPGNMAAAVHNELDYVKVKVAGVAGAEFFILAKGRLAQLGETAYEIVEEMKGTKLVGLAYQTPFAYLKDQDFDQTNAWKIWHADYVELGAEGTGAVHIAPAYGEDDMKLAQANNIPIRHHVDTAGHFMDFIGDGLAGRLVKPKDDDASGVDHKDADIEILKMLQAKGKIFKKENITHSYPHCWRCDTPLLNYATTSWFVNVPKIKDDLVAANAAVAWVPEHVGTNRFGKWLEGARDWAISRQRYWGAPLPIWKNATTGEYKVFGSLAELQQYVPKSGNTYFVMRHGESESNVRHVLNAEIGVENPLTDKGRQQVTAALAILPSDIDVIIYSPLQRTKESAEMLAAHLKLSPGHLLVDERVRELGMGEFEGKGIAEKKAAFTQDIDEFTVSVCGTETLGQLRKRVGEFLYELENKYQGKKILVVSHGDSLWMLEALASGADNLSAMRFGESYIKNAEVREIAFSPMPHNDDYILDYHRPYIDDIELIDTDGTSLVRVPDVFDCWFESGSMPYAQTHYPFENLDYSNPALGLRFPANFISESVDQTRGWFYSLMVLGVALFGKSPFDHVITNGLVLAEDGKKMSKSLRNYPDPMELADRVGVDAMRYYLLSSPLIRGEDLNFSEKEVLEQQRKNIGRLHNVLAMYEMFADETKAGAASKNVLDRWIVARLNQLVTETTVGYKAYELDKATRPLADFIDDLSVWYLRRSRDRFKSDVVEDKQAALATLRHTLRTLALVMAPVMPFYAEYLWLAVKEEGDAESVHLGAWPNGGEVDQTLIGEMSLVRETVTTALEARTKAGIKVRQPLNTLSLAIALAPEYAAILAEEINVKTVTYNDKQTEPVVLDVVITPELKAEGDVREFMRAVQERRKADGLAPQDRVELIIETTSEGEVVLQGFSDVIMKTVGATAITFDVNSGDEIKAGLYTYRLILKKL